MKPRQPKRQKSTFTHHQFNEVDHTAVFLHDHHNTTLFISKNQDKDEAINRFMKDHENSISFTIASGGKLTKAKFL